MTKYSIRGFTAGLAMAIIAAFLSYPNPASATTSVETKLALIGGRLVKLDAAIAAGACPNCPTTLAVIKADLAELKKLPDLHKEAREKLNELIAAMNALDAKLDDLPGLTAAEVVKQLSAKYGAGWEAAARRGGNSCETYVDALRNTGAMDTVAITALSTAVGHCAEQGAVAEGLATVVCKNGGVVKTNSVTIVCDAPKAAPAPDPPDWANAPPPAASSRSFAGWAASGLTGAVVLGMTGYLLGGDVSPSYVDATGVHRVGERDGAIVGAIVGGLLGAGVYALVK